MVCGQVIRDKYKVDQYMSENHLLIANKIKAFHVPISAPSFRVGVKNLLQTNGLGKHSITVVTNDKCSRFGFNLPLHILLR